MVGVKSAFAFHHMRQSLACQSSKAFRQILRTKARRAALAVPSTKEYVEFDNDDGNRQTMLPRTLNPTQNIRDSAEKALEGLLSTSGTRYQAVWESYLALKDIVDKYRGPPIPQHILQGVLRQCTPTWHALRQNAAQLVDESGVWKRLQSPLPHESRLRSVLHYMKNSRQLPTEDDFHVIILQMAAVGHVTGAVAVLEEMEATEGVTPSATTFKHILRACVFALESTASSEAKLQVSSTVTTVVSKVMQRIRDLDVDVNERLVELMLRVLKEQENTEACEHILRLACAFDVHRPDRMPEEFEKKLKEADERKIPLPIPVPVTTSMLTTLVNLYGAQGELPRMITTFEVLTNPYPLPSNLPSPQSDWWDAEDEYDVANPVIQTPLKHRPEYIWEPPRSTPNSATFAIMIRHLAWAQERLLCEHYMLLAEEYDKIESIRLRDELSRQLQLLESISSKANPDRLPQEALPELSLIDAPRFHITPIMFQPVFAYANQARLTELMRWMRQHLRGTIGRREKDLDFFKKSYESLPAPSVPHGAEVRLNSRHQLCRCFRFKQDNHLIILSSDVDYSKVTGVSDVHKPFDLQFHIKLVESTLAGLRIMLERADEVVARLSQRTLERMTRRVWRHQDVYLSDVGYRTLIGREEWSDRIEWKKWDGPVTAVNMGHQRIPPKDAAPAPSRWMDSRLANRSVAKEEDDSLESSDEPK